MSYKSPIDILYGDIETKVEGEVVKAIQGYKIDINKEELIKALNYDRNQYSKGYKDGVNDAIDKIRAKIENHCGYTTESHCRYCYHCNNVMGVREILKVIDKYKESEE